jgi:diguanylate cyclase (GGDEF)-like protein
MREKPDPTEQMGLQSRLRSELTKLEARNRDIRWLTVVAAAVLILGGFTLLAGGSFWYEPSLEIKIPPPIFFVVMIAVILLVLYLARRELEMRKLSLVTIQQTLQAESEQTASMFDAVTNVFSRRFLLELLHKEIARAERNRRPLALIMCDLNNFKQVNDRLGHVVGDEVLAQIAGILKSCVRGSDHVVRYGGDEFLLILSETDEAGALAVRARIQEKVAEWDRSGRPGDLPISVSLGLYLHVPGQTAEQDVAEADARMYAEKQALRTMSP